MSSYANNILQYGLIDAHKLYAIYASGSDCFVSYINGTDIRWFDPPHMYVEFGDMMIDNLLLHWDVVVVDGVDICIVPCHSNQVGEYTPIFNQAIPIQVAFNYYG